MRAGEQLSRARFWDLLLLPEAAQFPSSFVRRKEFGLLLAELDSRDGHERHAARIRKFLGLYSTQREALAARERLGRRGFLRTIDADIEKQDADNPPWSTEREESHGV